MLADMARYEASAEGGQGNGFAVQGSPVHLRAWKLYLVHTHDGAAEESCEGEGKSWLRLHLRL